MGRDQTAPEKGIHTSSCLKPLQHRAVLRSHVHTRRIHFRGFQHCGSIVSSRPVKTATCQISRKTGTCCVDQLTAGMFYRKAARELRKQTRGDLVSSVGSSESLRRLHLKAPVIGGYELLHLKHASWWVQDQG